MTAKKTSKRSPKTSKKKVEIGKVYISASFNNTLITITDPQGDVLSWGSA
ncbi:30S ribosomal protein S11, partial [bacterium]|nr:30S ribosomal protein S11 [bacterium]